MNEKYTHVTMVLDKSASMSDVVSDTIGGFNKFLTDQKEDKEKATISLFQFSNKIDPVYTMKDMQSAEEITKKTYIADGPSTRLLDAIGVAISDTGKDLQNLDEKERPGKVIIVIQTDGLENSSNEYSLDQVKEMIAHQEEKYNWKFIFLGAGIEAVGQAAHLGFAKANTMSYNNTSRGNDAMYGGLSHSVLSLRSVSLDAFAGASAFSDEQLQEIQNTK